METRNSLSPEAPKTGLMQVVMQELLIEILGNLDATTLAGCCAVCHSMRQIANGHTLWHTAFSKRWGAAYLSLLERAECLGNLPRLQLLLQVLALHPPQGPLGRPFTLN